MALNPINPPPPVARPPRPGSHALWIVGLVLALLIAACVFTIYAGIRILSNNVVIREAKSPSGTQRVVVTSPVGSIEVHKDVPADVALLGLPAYPGARRLLNSGSAAFSASFANRKQVGVMAAKFETPDALDKVADFYRTRLNGQITRVIRKDSRDKAVFEIKEADEEKIVALHQADGGTRIDLVKIIFGNNEAN